MTERDRFGIAAALAAFAVAGFLALPFLPFLGAAAVMLAAAAVVGMSAYLWANKADRGGEPNWWFNLRWKSGRLIRRAGEYLRSLNGGRAIASVLNQKASRKARNR